MKKYILIGILWLASICLAISIVSPGGFPNRFMITSHGYMVGQKVDCDKVDWGNEFDDAEVTGSCYEWVKNERFAK